MCIRDSYNYGVEKTLSTVAEQIQKTGHSRISVVFATHNSISIDRGIELLEKYGMAKRQGETNKLVVSGEIAGSIAFAQLYGQLFFFFLGLLVVLILINCRYER